MVCSISPWSGTRRESQIRKDGRCSLKTCSTGRTLGPKELEPCPTAPTAAERFAQDMLP